MSEGVLEIDLNDGGGLHRFTSYKQLRRWIDTEDEAWRWLSEGGYRDPMGLTGHFANRLNWARGEIENSSQAGHAVDFNRTILESLYLRSEILLHSQGDLGRRVLDIREGAGPTAGAWACAVALRRLGFNQTADLDEIRGALLVALPGAIDPDSVARRLASERRNLKDRADRLIDRLIDAEAEREEADLTARALARRLAIRMARRRFAAWRRQFDSGRAEAAQLQAAFASQAAETAEDFAGIKAAYLEAMALQAPVEYWKGKGKEHATAEAKARNRVLAFFPLAGIVLAVLFAATAWFLLTHTTRDSPTALFLVVSGGLATIAGMAFWAGRLLTRLYLSEHHLRNDADERAVMTKTYLALTREKAAAEGDRQIILAALFRSTPDGIVKDDSPMDLSVPTLIAKAIAPK